jgi:dipeptidyl-peptidase-4
MADTRRLELNDLAAPPGLTDFVPQDPRFSGDGKRLWYLAGEDDPMSLVLWEQDLETGGRRVLMQAKDVSYTPEELLQRERQRVRFGGITGYQVGHRDGEPVFLAGVGGRILVRVGETAAATVPHVKDAVNPGLLEDGLRAVYVRAGDLYVCDLTTGAERRLTEGAGPGFSHGLAEYVAQEELSRSHGFWVSADARFLAYTEVDEREIPEFPIVHYEDERPWVETPRYPMAGEANARVRLGVMPLAGGETYFVEGLGGDDEAYLVKVVWTPDNLMAYALLGRDHRRLEWRLFDPVSQSIRPLGSEHSDHWVNVGAVHTFLDDGSFLTSSEEDGFRHLYVWKDGEARQLTHGAWMVTELHAVDRSAGLVYFTATRESPLERHLYRVALEGGEVTRITEGQGLHHVQVSVAAGRFLDQHQNRQHATRSIVRRLQDAGETLKIHEAPDGTAQALGVSVPDIVHFAAEDGTTLYGAVYRPEGPGPHPVIVSVYGGPHAQSVSDSFALTADLEAQYLAQHGYLVFKMDNRGMANRGVAFERALFRSFGTVEVQDLVAGVRWLGATQGADLSRVGVYGWSYGGYMTLMLMEKAPEIFRAGVSGAPVTDYRFYDTAYTERYMETPAKNQEGYDEGSALKHVDQLTGELLIIHGLIDENVHFRNTAALLLRLAEAEKAVELTLLPSSRHGPRGRTLRLQVARRRTEFLMAHV